MTDADKITCWNLVDELRSSEGDTVCIVSDNPDGEPNCAVECCGEWTDWRHEQFFGATVLRALLAAVDRYREALK